MSEFEKEVRELFDLCYRVIEELPGVGISFDFSQNGLDIYVKKDESKIYSESKEEFEWDFHSSMFENLPQHSRKEYEKSKKYILELLIDGRCPLNAESGGTEAPADNGADNDSERASVGAEQAESVHS